MKIMKSQPTHDVIKSANYGGAFDIDPHQYFTKDEIVEFGDVVAEALTQKYKVTFQLYDAYIVDYCRLVVDIEDDNYYTYTANIDIDMRRIRSPRDIMKYKSEAVSQISKAYREMYNEEI